MKREELLGKLETVKPALLSGNNLIPIMTRFWFTGERVTAFNDQISISTPLETEFKGALPSYVYDLLKTSSAKDVEFEATREGITIKADRGTWKVDMNPPEQFDVFLEQIPRTKNLVVSKGDEAGAKRLKTFCRGIELCLKSTSDDTSRPEHLGITYLINDGFVCLFSTSGATLSYTKVPAEGWPQLNHPAIMPVLFCEQLAKLMKSEKDPKMSFVIGGDHVAAAVNGTTIFGRLIENAHPLDFLSIINRLAPKGIDKKVIKIPDKLKDLVERAVIISESKISRTRTAIAIKNGAATLSSKSERGDIKDTIEMPDHSDVETKFEAKLLKEGLQSNDRILFTKACCVMRNKYGIFLVASGAD